jgi:hypothetical protein
MTRRMKGKIKTRMNNQIQIIAVDICEGFHGGLLKYVVWLISLFLCSRKTPAVIIGEISQALYRIRSLVISSYYTVLSCEA